MAHRLGLAVVTVAVASGGGLAAAGSAQAVGCHAFKTAVESASNGDVITLDGGLHCHATYTLPANKSPLSFTIRGGGTGATLDGAGKSSRIMTGLANPGKQLYVTVRNLTFRNGTSSTEAHAGALLLSGEDVSATIDHDRFLANTCTGSCEGGALAILSGSTRTVAVTNSTFGDGTAAGANSAKFGGALAIENNGGGPSATVAGNKFNRNTSLGVGGALVLTVNTLGRTATINDNVFTDNRGHGTRGGAADVGTNSLTLRRNKFIGNRLVNTTSSVVRGGGLSATGDQSRGATLDQSGNRFVGNRIVRGSQANYDTGGGGEWVDAYALTSRNDRFTSNSIPAPSGTGAAEGGGIGIEGCPTAVKARLENAAVAGNTAGAGAHGAGVYVGGCSFGPVRMSIVDSTIAGNTTSGVGATSGLFGGPDDKLTMRNSIVAANSGGTDLTGFGAGLTVSSSDACAPAVVPGGNICQNPLLVDAPHGNVHERSVSPTIDHGANAKVPSTLKKDYEGDKRILGAGVDMGADEFKP